MAENILDKIVDRKKQEVATAKQKAPETELLEKLPRHRAPRAFADALTTPGIHIIAEIKRASPSKGVIRPNLDPQKLAKSYETGGASAISVLTDTDFFKGSLEDLVKARAATSIPVLRKDFIVSSYQLYQTALMGADAVLLIVRILSPGQLTDYLHLCRQLHLDTLVEVHSERDIEIASASGARLIGINNRNLKSFETDIRISMRLAERLSPNQIPVAASGIRCRKDIDNNLEAGIHNFLIGESLVRAQHPVLFIKTLLTGHKNEYST
jgi:indole-3-glycerol phosphate synthase